MRRAYLSLAILAAVLAFGVVMLGAYVRLSAAGLGCPDWPGCYGHISVPHTEQAIARADALYAHRPVEAVRAWKEMIHRYFAGSLAVLILILTVTAWWRRPRDVRQPVVLPTVLLGLVIFQALLGMWTVTLLLFPPVVMGHLLGGMSLFALLTWLVWWSSGWLRTADGARNWMRALAVAGLAVLIIQIALGGWVSSNYAAIACPDFPTCQGHWWPPHMNFASGFAWHGIGPDYQGGILTDSARVAIHLTHRLGALLTFIVLGLASLVFMTRGTQPVLRVCGAVVALLLLCQIALGISMIEFGWPLAVADLHNGCAALLLAATVALNWAAWTKPLPAHSP